MQERRKWREYQKKEKLKQRKTDKDSQPDWKDHVFMIGESALTRECRTMTGESSALTKECKVKNKSFTAILDTGASINVISKDIVKKIGLVTRRVDKVIRTVGSEMRLDEMVYLEIEIGTTHARIKAYVVDNLPADILLEIPFLKQYSRGFNEMFHELSPDWDRGEDSPKVCAADVRSRLEALLDKYPDLVLDDDEIPDPTRYYKGQTFELGLPEGKRDKRYFRAQYPPDPHKIEKYRELLEPLIKAGVYVES